MIRSTQIIYTIFDACYLINLEKRSDRLLHALNQCSRANLYKFVISSKEMNNTGIPLPESYSLNVPNYITRIPAIDGNCLNVESLYKSGAISPLGYERFKLPLEEKLFGMDLTPGAIGCALSHRAVWKMIVEKQQKCALILEDDLEFSHVFSKTLMKRWSFVPNDWEIVYLGGLDLLSGGKTRLFIGDGVRYAYNGHRELTAYVIHADAARKCLDASSCLTWQIDTHITSSLKIDPHSDQEYIASPLSYVLQPSLVIQLTTFGSDVQKHSASNPSLEDASRRLREFVGGKTSVR